MPPPHRPTVRQLHFLRAAVPPPERAARRRPSARTRRAVAPTAAVAVAGLLALAVTANAQAATINVSPAGGDANPGSATAPLKTLTKALSLARSGDTVKLAAGASRS